MEHTLHCDPRPFDGAAAGRKTLELQVEDRGFAVGDALVLVRTEHSAEEMRAGAPLVESGARLRASVTHLLLGPIPAYGLGENKVILCIEAKPGFDEPLFRERVPEAAARQLAVALAWLTECQLATLESLEMRKSSSKSDVARQRSICDDAVRHCHELGVTPSGIYGQKCGRLHDRLQALANKGGVQ